MLHKDASDVGREPVDVPGGEAGQQRGLTRAVLTHHPVPFPALEFQRRGPEQDLAREREYDPVEVEAVSLLLLLGAPVRRSIPGCRSASPEVVSHRVVEQ